MKHANPESPHLLPTVKKSSRSRAAKVNRKHSSTQPIPMPDSNGIVRFRVTKQVLPGGCVLHLPPPWCWNLRELVEKWMAAAESASNGDNAA